MELVQGHYTNVQSIENCIENSVENCDSLNPCAHVQKPERHVTATVIIKRANDVVFFSFCT